MEDAVATAESLRQQLEGLSGEELEAEFSNLAALHSDDAPPIGTEQPLIAQTACNNCTLKNLRHKY